jgi:hypothetical protein
MNTLFGIWRKGLGFLKVQDDYVAIARREVANEMARRIGPDACVTFLDESREVNAELERLYLQNEQRPRWTLKAIRRM